jgi:TolB-like protein
LAEPAAPVRRRRSALIWTAAAVLLAAAALLAWISIARTRGAPIDAIAVLPFTNVSASPDTEYLSDGITENLINALSQLPGIRVAARSVVFRYKGRNDDPQQIGHDLNVRAILTGRVSERERMLVVRTELMDVSTGSQLWGGQYTRNVADILSLQDQIAADIFDRLRVRLTGEDRQRVTKRHTENAEAYQLYLQGRYHWNKGTIPAFKKAIEYFQQAIDKDPNYALAYAGLADSYLLLGSYWVEAIPEAKTAALKAVQLDPALAEAHIAAGHIKLRFDWDWQGAERELKRGIELNPGSALGHNQYAMYLAAMGRLGEAITEAQHAQQLDPLSPIINADLGWYLFEAGRQNEAAEQFRKALEIDPNHVSAHLGLGTLEARLGQLQDGIAEVRKAFTLSEDSPVMLGHLGYVYAVSGKREDTRKVLQQLDELSKRTYVSSWAVASVYAGLGNPDQTMVWLDKAYAERDFSLVLIKVAPWFESVRSDRRFHDLVKRMNLPD